MEDNKDKLISEVKFAGSVTFGKAPNPKDLPMPKIINYVNFNKINYVNFNKINYEKTKIILNRIISN